MGPSHSCLAIVSAAAMPSSPSTPLVSGGVWEKVTLPPPPLLLDARWIDVALLALLIAGLTGLALLGGLVDVESLLGGRARETADLEVDIGIFAADFFPPTL